MSQINSIPKQQTKQIIESKIQKQLDNKIEEQQAGKDQKNEKIMDMSKKKQQTILQDCFNQNVKFKQWEKQSKWQLFHSSHYDWWAFPINSGSASYGTAYKLYPQHIVSMSNNPKFINALKQNATMVCKSWGWDLQKCQYIPKKQRSEQQRWQRWPIRLSKMCRSLQIFSKTHWQVYVLFQNAIFYAVELLKEHKKFSYGGKDLTPYFYKKHKQIIDNKQEDHKAGRAQIKKQEVKDKDKDKEQHSEQKDHKQIKFNYCNKTQTKASKKQDDGNQSNSNKRDQKQQNRN